MTKDMFIEAKIYMLKKIQTSNHILNKMVDFQTQETMACNM